MTKRVAAILLTISLLINIVLISVIVKGFIGESPGGTQLAYAISGNKGNPEEDLINVINNTKKELDIAIYNLDNEQIADVISSASERGVSIRIIADGENAENKDSKEILNELKKLNIPIKIDVGKKMHVKMTISDNQTVVTGSFNYTKDSAEDNQEILLTVNNNELASSIKTTFNELWNSNSMTDW